MESLGSWEVDLRVHRISNTVVTIDPVTTEIMRHLTPDAWRVLARHTDPEVRFQVAISPATPLEVLNMMAKDDWDYAVGMVLFYRLEDEELWGDVTCRLDSMAHQNGLAINPTDTIATASYRGLSIIMSCWKNPQHLEAATQELERRGGILGLLSAI